MSEDFTFCPSGCRRLSQTPSTILLDSCCIAADQLGKPEAHLHLPDLRGELGAMQESCKIVETYLASTRLLPFLL